MKTKLAILGLCFVLAAQALAQNCTNFINQGRAALAARNMTNACLSFSNAVVQCPDDPTANALYAATRLLFLVSKPPADGFLTRLGITGAGRNLYDWQAQAPQDANGRYAPPAGVSAKEGALLIRTNLLPEITAALANLAKLGNNGFLLNLVSNETASADVTLDYGDFLLMRAGLHLFEYLGYTIHSWNLDAQLTAIKALYNTNNHEFNVQRLLADHPQLFTFATTADLAAARRSFTNGVDLYLQASSFIRSRPANVTRLFTWDPEMAEDEYKFRLLLADLRTSLQGPTVLRVETNLTVHLAKHFDGSKAPRAMFPSFTNNLFIEGTLPDPTFGGVIQGRSRQKVEEGLSHMLPMKSPAVRLCVLAKGQNYVQTGSGDPTIQTTEAHSSGAWVDPEDSASVTNVTFRLPNGTTFPLPYDPDRGRWGGDQDYNTKAELDANAPLGAYQMTIATRSDGTRTLNLNAPADAYPTALRVSNFTAAQTINPNLDFVLTWDAIPGGTTNDFVQLWIEGQNSQVFETPQPWQDGALNGLSTSVRIPAGTLSWDGPEFQAGLVVAKVTSVDRTTFPGGIVIVGFYRGTGFSLRTVDITQYAVLKGQRFVQTNSSTPVLDEFSPFEFQTFATASNWDILTNVTLRLPNGVIRTNPSSYLGLGFELNDWLDTQGDLDAAYPNGTYQYTLDARHDGRRTPALSLTGNSYPSTPRISNYAAVQTIDGAEDFTLRWDAFAGGTVNDHIQVLIGDGEGQPMRKDAHEGEYGYAVYTPDFGEPGALDGTVTSLVIPAFTFKSGETIRGRLIFGKATQLDGPDLQEGVACFDAETGKLLWKRTFNDFLSDTIYLRYATSSAAIDPETGNVYMQGTQGVLAAFTAAGEPLWSHSLMEKFGRLTFPNSRTASPLIDRDLVITRGITSNWGAQGAAGDRFYAFDKNSGELVWSSSPGSRPMDNSFSHPYLTWFHGKRVLISACGDGSVACLNARTGDPIWRVPLAKAGINATILVHNNDKVISIYGTPYEPGQLVAFRMPDVEPTNSLSAPVVVERSAIELWSDSDISTSTSSPILVGDRLYVTKEKGDFVAVDVATGKVLWSMKLGIEQRNSCPLYADGKLYVPILDNKADIAGKADQAGGGEAAAKTTQGKGGFFVLADRGTSAEVLSHLELDGRCFGTPVAYNGKIYLQTVRKLYAFGKPGNNPGLPPPVAEAAWPSPGPAAQLQIVPSEVLLHPGDTASFRARKLDANGLLVEDVADVKQLQWAGYIPPTALVKASMDASFNADKQLAVAGNAKKSAGAFEARLGGLKGYIRGRVLPRLPFLEDFESVELSNTTTNTIEPPTKFAYPPLPWIGARFRFEVRDLEGSKVLTKTIDNKLFQRVTAFIGDADMKNYTIQADVRSEGTARKMSEVGLVNQRYIAFLKGNAQQLEVNSNQERLKVAVPFRWKPNIWYTLKTRVDIAPDGSGTVRAKAWLKGSAEPDAWTIEVPHQTAHRQGSPGLYALSPQEMRVFIDNISVTPN